MNYLPPTLRAAGVQMVFDGLLLNHAVQLGLAA